MSVDPEVFRALFGSVPASVSIVTAVDAAGEPRGFTCKAFSAVSLAPPLLLICGAKDSRTVLAIESSGAFVVNVLAEGGQRASEVFASSAAYKFADVDWLPSAAANGSPILTGITMAHAECTVLQQISAGDHWVIIGQVADAELFPRRPLLHHQRAYSVWHPRTPAPIR